MVFKYACAECGFGFDTTDPRVAKVQKSRHKKVCCAAFTAPDRAAPKATVSNTACLILSLRRFQARARACKKAMHQLGFENTQVFYGYDAAAEKLVAMFRANFSDKNFAELGIEPVL